MNTEHVRQVVVVTGATGVAETSAERVLCRLPPLTASAVK